MPEGIHVFKDQMKIAYRLIEFWGWTLEINYSKTFNFWIDHWNPEKLYYGEYNNF